MKLAVYLGVVIISLNLLLSNTYVDTNISYKAGLQTENREIKDIKEIIGIILAEEFSSSREDRSRIIPKLSNSENPCLQTNGNNKIEYISSENITKDMLPAIPCIQLVLLSPEEIEKEVKEKAIEYIVFDRIKKEGDSIIVTFTFWHRSYAFHFSRGITYTFTKKEGKWEKSGDVSVTESIS